MSVAETYNKNIPAYYDTMYLDGFKPHEIYASFKKQSREIANENEETNVNVVVEEWEPIAKIKRRKRKNLF